MATNLQNYQSGIIQRGLYPNKEAVINAGIKKKIINYPDKIYDFWDNNMSAITSAMATANNANNNANSTDTSLIWWILSNWQLSIIGAIAIMLLLK